MKPSTNRSLGCHLVSKPEELGSKESEGNPSGNPKNPVQESRVSTTTPGLHIHTDLQLPSLNGQTATFWQIVRDNPNDLPVQIANKLQAVTGRNLTGAQVKQLIAAGPPPAIDPDDEFI